MFPLDLRWTSCLTVPQVSFHFRFVPAFLALTHLCWRTSESYLLIFLSMIKKCLCRDKDRQTEREREREREREKRQTHSFKITVCLVLLFCWCCCCLVFISYSNLTLLGSSYTLQFLTCLSRKHSEVPSSSRDYCLCWTEFFRVSCFSLHRNLPEQNFLYPKH